MSVLQIDAINTVIRSHYLPLFSRHGHYDRTLLDKKLFDSRGQKPATRSFFEYWGHECSLLPINLYPLFEWRRQDASNGIGVYRQIYQMAKENATLVNKVKSEVLERGPVSCSDLDSDARGPGMWEWSNTKTALEYLFWAGELASAGRRGFQRLYTAPEKAIPPSLLASNRRNRQDDQMALLELAATALGVGTESDLRDYFRLPAADSKVALAGLVSSGKLEQVSVQGWQLPAYLLPGTVVPRAMTACTLLTPFDPIVWCRDRTERLFNFRYRIEIYVPADKRVFGYWVMPFLLDDKLVARVDLKADRDSGRLIVKGAWTEEGVSARSVAPALTRALCEMAHWLNLAEIEVLRKGDLSRHLDSLQRAVPLL